MRSTVLLCLGLVLVGAGCMGGPNVNTVTVKGKLLRDGQPLVGQSSGGDDQSGPPSYDGYELTFYADGVNEGSVQVDGSGQFSVDLPPNKKYKVIVTRVKISAGPPAETPTGDVPMLATQKDESLEKFGSLDSTPIEIEVGGGATEVTIDLAKY